MKMEAITTFLKDQPDVKKVYLLNQNYAHGHQVAKYAKEGLAKKRSDVQIVGEDLHPLARARLRALRGQDQGRRRGHRDHRQLGLDLALLVKAASEAGYNGTTYAGVTGTPTAMGAAGAGRVYQAAYNYNNMGGQMDTWANEFKAKFNDDFYTGSVIHIYSALARRWPRPRAPTW
ncbi:hypothetical protein ACRAWF_24875 [Streptomyces sp. L7]